MRDTNMQLSSWTNCQWSLTSRCLFGRQIGKLVEHLFELKRNIILATDLFAIN